jgi:uncharacterized protein
MPISKELLEILACPKCKGELELKADESGLICHACRLVYPIREDIPIMLIEEAQGLE